MSTQSYSSMLHIDKGIQCELGCMNNMYHIDKFSASVRKSILTSFIRLHDVQNLDWSKTVYRFDVTNIAKSHEDCGMLCALEYPSKCQLYIQDSMTCVLGTLTKADGAYNAIGSSRDVYIDTSKIFCFEHMHSCLKNYYQNFHPQPHFQMLSMVNSPQVTTNLEQFGHQMYRH